MNWRFFIVSLIITGPALLGFAARSQQYLTYAPPGAKDRWVEVPEGDFNDFGWLVHNLKIYGGPGDYHVVGRPGNQRRHLNALKPLNDSGATLPDAYYKMSHKGSSDFLSNAEGLRALAVQQEQQAASLNRKNLSRASAGKRKPLLSMPSLSRSSVLTGFASFRAMNELVASGDVRTPGNRILQTICPYSHFGDLIKTSAGAIAIAVGSDYAGEQIEGLKSSKVKTGLFVASGLSGLGFAGVGIHEAWNGKRSWPYFTGAAGCAKVAWHSYSRGASSKHPEELN